MRSITQTGKMEGIILDVQGMKFRNNKFILKEIAILTKHCAFHAFIKSPCSFHKLKQNQKIQAKWLTKNYHGIDWNDGDMTLFELKKLVKPFISDRVIFVKGLEKCDWIKSILMDDSLQCNNLEDIGCDVNLNKLSFITESRTCSKHAANKDFQCALRNILLLQKWIKEGKEFVLG